MLPFFRNMFPELQDVTNRYLFIHVPFRPN